MSRLWIILAAGVLFSLGSPAAAGTVEPGSGGGVTWQAGVDGVEIEWADDGKVKRISSRFSTPVEFSDRRGISKAQIIAEEKAKAAIVRFMDQSVATTRIVADVQSDLSKASQLRETGKAAQVKKTDERTMIEALTEVTTSFSAGRLKGVIVLEKGYDKAAEEAWVVVGISDKTIRAAGDIKAMTQPPRPAGTSAGPDGVTTQGSEIRQTKKKDW